MSVHRCPVHDVLFESNKPPTQDGHAKCPFCNPQAKPKDSEGREVTREPEQIAGRD